MFASLIRWSLLAAICFPAAAHAAQVTILTSFPPELIAVYKKAFEAAHPDVRVQVITKSASEFVATLDKTPLDKRPDVVWASDPGAFAALARKNYLRSGEHLRNKGIPQAIGNLPMDGQNGLYFGQALSGYGVMWNRDYLRQNGLQLPLQWTDLTKPSYFGHVAFSSPLRSGTSHLTAEVILQGEGWDAGWSQLALIAGNCSEILQRSGDVPALIKQGKTGAGLVVDFLGLAAKTAQGNIDFTYPIKTTVLPASIGVVNKSESPESGDLFVKFALSNAGQELMYDPQISRMPASPYAAASLKVPSNFPNVYAVARKSPVKFDLTTYETRRLLVAALFERTITQPHAELRRAVQAIHQAEKAVARKPNTEASNKLREARALVTRPVVQEADIPKELRRSDLADAAGETGHPWTDMARANYQKAEQLAMAAAR